MVIQVPRVFEIRGNLITKGPAALTFSAGTPDSLDSAEHKSDTVPILGTINRYCTGNKRWCQTRCVPLITYHIIPN